MGKTFRVEDESDEYEDVSRRRKERQIKGFLQNKKVDKRDEYPRDNPKKYDPRLED